MFGLGRFGGNIALALQKDGYQILAVDFDPKQVKFWQAQGILAKYGDIEDPDLPEQVPLDKSSAVISSLADVQLNLGLIRLLKYTGYKGKIAVTAHRALDALTLQQEENIIVLLPFADAAASITSKIFKRTEELDTI